MSAVKNAFHDKIVFNADIEAGHVEAPCEGCGEDFLETDTSPNVEAFEVLDRLLCDDCAEQELADHGQFGVGA